jgi:hypothetical protein
VVSELASAPISIVCYLPGDVETMRQID